MKPPTKHSEIVIDQLIHDPAQGHIFRVVCDPVLHKEIEQIVGVGSVVEFDSGTIWVHIDPRYSAHEVYVYVGSELTRLAKETKLTREIDEVANALSAKHL